MPLRGWIAAVAVIAVIAASSCSDGADRDTTLVSRRFTETELDTSCARTAQPCDQVFRGRTYRTADGDTVVSDRWRVSFDLDVGDVPEVSCGSELFVRAYTGVATNFSVDVAELLTFEDGSAVRLFPERATQVFDECGELVGRWRGVAGRYEGRSGPFRLVENRLQVTLTLDDPSG